MDLQSDGAGGKNTTSQQLEHLSSGGGGVDGGGLNYYSGSPTTPTSPLSPVHPDDDAGTPVAFRGGVVSSRARQRRDSMDSNVSEVSTTSNLFRINEVPTSGFSMMQVGGSHQPRGAL